MLGSPPSKKAGANLQCKKKIFIFFLTREKEDLNSRGERGRMNRGPPQCEEDLYFPRKDPSGLIAMLGGEVLQKGGGGGAF